MDSPLPRPVRLYRREGADHSCPYGRKAVDLLRRNDIPFEDHRLSSREQAERFMEAHGVTSTPQIFAGDERIGGFTDLARRLGQDSGPEPRPSSLPVLAVFGVAALVSAVQGTGVAGFMGMALTILATLKLMDPASFRATFAAYDLLSQTLRPYGHLYPWLELLVGLAILGPWGAAPIGLLAVAIGLEGAISVVKAVWIDRRDLNCACVGGNSRTPLGTLSLLENLAMVAMGLALALRHSQ